MEKPSNALKEEIDKHWGDNQTEFSRVSGVPQTVLSRICAGKDAHGLQWAKIEHHTQGRVTALRHFPPQCWAERGAAKESRRKRKLAGGGTHRPKGKPNGRKKSSPRGVK